MRLRVIPERHLDSGLDARIRSMLCTCFPDAAEDFGRGRAWHGSAPAWTVLAEDPGAIVCGHLGIVDRVIRVGERTLRVAGLQSVCVSAARRGEGLAAKLFHRAATLMRDRAFDAGLLFCVPALAPFYARHAWRLLEGVSVTRIDRNGAELLLPPGSTTMWLPVRITQWPAGDVHLAGNDW